MLGSRIHGVVDNDRHKAPGAFVEGHLTSLHALTSELRSLEAESRNVCICGDSGERVVFHHAQFMVE